MHFSDGFPLITHSTAGIEISTTHLYKLANPLQYAFLHVYEGKVKLPSYLYETIPSYLYVPISLGTRYDTRTLKGISSIFFISFGIFTVLLVI